MTMKKEAHNRWERRPGVVYFITASSPPVAVKIGVASQKSLQKRLSEHQGSNHEVLKLIGAIRFEEGERPMKSAESHEKELHKLFDHLRRFKNGTPGGNGSMQRSVCDKYKSGDKLEGRH